MEDVWKDYDIKKVRLLKEIALPGMEHLIKLTPERKDRDSDSDFVLKKTLAGGGIGIATAMINNYHRPHSTIRPTVGAILGASAGFLGAKSRNRARNKSKEKARRLIESKKKSNTR